MTALSIAAGLTLYFARHGETQANVRKQFSGIKDTPLTPRGHDQSRAIGTIMKGVPGAASLDFVSSPLQRAKTTMQIARETMGLPRTGYHTDPRLEEIDLGVWDQLTNDEARAFDPTLFARRNADKWNVRIPEGENYADVAKRVESFVAHLERDTFAISHGATTRILRGLFGSLTWQQISSLDEPQGCVFRVRDNVVERLDP